MENGALHWRACVQMCMCERACVNVGGGNIIVGAICIERCTDVPVCPFVFQLCVHACVARAFRVAL